MSHERGVAEQEQTRRIVVPTPTLYESAMPRLMLSNELWSKLEKILIQQAIYRKPDLRMTVEGIQKLFNDGSAPQTGRVSAARRWGLPDQTAKLRQDQLPWQTRHFADKAGTGHGFAD